MAYIPTCSVALVNNDCPAGWVVQYIPELVITKSDLIEIILASIVCMCTAYAFRAVRLSIHD